MWLNLGRGRQTNYFYEKLTFDKKNFRVFLNMNLWPISMPAASGPKVIYPGPF